jgi:Na+-driven multidrug efflux pump
VNRRLIREILGKSGMMFLSDISFAVSETIMIALYNGRGGAEVVAGMAAGWAIANIFFLFFSGIQTTATVLVGGSLGAGMLDQGRQRAGWITSGSVVMGFAMMLAGAGLSSLIIPLVYANLTAEARSICLGLVSVILVYMPLWSVLNCQFAISRAGGDTALGMYTDVSVNTLIFLPAAFILAFFTTLSPVVMFAILKTTDVIKYFIARYLYKKEKWIRNLTIREPNPK